MKSQNLSRTSKEKTLSFDVPFQVKDNSQQELEMWFAVAHVLKAIPNRNRTQNHTAYYNEVHVRVYDLVNGLQLDQSDWIVE